MVSAGSRTETGLAVASGAHAIRDISHWPAGRPDRSNSAWRERGRTTGSRGFQPGPSGRRIRVTACSTVPGRAPLTVRATRTGAISSEGTAAARAPSAITLTVPFASVIAALLICSWLRPGAFAPRGRGGPRLRCDRRRGGACAVDRRQLVGHPTTDGLEVPAGPRLSFLFGLDLGSLDLDAALPDIADLALTENN
jgi:hypothetical protein